MADTISHVWQTVEQAAVTLNCSTRTIARRIAGGTMESRVDENGRRLVLVQTMTAAAEDHAAHDPTAPIEDAGPSTAIATPVQQSEGLMINEKAAGMLAVLQSTIDAAREDAHVARTGARWAWAGVATLALVLVGSTLYLNQTATRSEMKATFLERQVSDTKAELGQTRNDLLAATAAKAVAEQEKSVAIVRVKDASEKLAEAEKARELAAAQAEEARKAAAVKPVVEHKAPTTLPIKQLVNLFNDDGR